MEPGNIEIACVTTSMLQILFHVITVALTNDIWMLCLHNVEFNEGYDGSLETLQLNAFGILLISLTPIKGI